MNKNLNKEDFFLNMNITVFENAGKPTIQFRKIITLCDKNKDFFKKMIVESFNDSTIIVPVSLEFKDKAKALETLRRMGLIEGKYKLTFE
jgi:hypothetical protein